MELISTQVQGAVPVTILKLVGALDGSNYLEVISKGKSLYAAGARRLLVDLSEVNFMSSAGIVALHTLVLIFRGEQVPDLESGWNALRSIDREESAVKQPFVKLLNPQPRISRTLEMSGMDVFIEAFTDQDTAVSSF